MSDNSNDTAARLRAIMEAWRLESADAAGMFGVDGASVTNWLRHGVPTIQLTVLEDLATATEMLQRYVRADRIPVVVRRPVDQLDGESLLHLAHGRRHDEVVLAVQMMFDLRRVQP